MVNLLSNKINILISIFIIFFLSLNVLANTNITERETEHSLLNKNFKVLTSTSSFSFYGCSKNILYKINNIVATCKYHYQGYHHNDKDAVILMKDYKMEGYDHTFYYLCIDHHLCHPVTLGN